MVRIILIMLFLFAAVVAVAQPAQQTDTSAKATRTIVVRRKPLLPYVKVEYNMFAVCATESRQLSFDSTNNGSWTNAALFDTACIPAGLERVLPQHRVQFGRTYAQNITYTYSPADSNRTDTMLVGFWIDRTGKIKNNYPDSPEATTMPPELYNQLVLISKSFQVYGDKGGGYFTRRKFLRPSEFRRSDYYCTVRIIVSARPLTPEQRIAGESAIPVMDYPIGGALGLEQR
ncbi:MAG: hypothetical protein IM638_14240 [Bacteroidetes bacterium]|nr:hypothetical protein [Bacteroidota bacterium]